MSNLNSDHICGIQIPIEGSRSLTILGAYVPSSDQSLGYLKLYTSIINKTRIDFLINTLKPEIKVLRGLIRKKRGNTYSVCEINKIHKSAEEPKKIKDHSVTALDNSTWRVQSQTTNTQYIIQQHNQSCVYKCKLLCSTCAICPHTYVLLYMPGFYTPLHCLQAYTFNTHLEHKSPGPES